MKKTLIVFGAFGALGSGVTEVLLKKNYDSTYLFDFNAEKNPFTSYGVTKINIGDLAIEENVAAAFSRIKREDDSQYFLFSTVGGFKGGTEVKDTSPEDLDLMFSINMKSNFWIAKHFVKLAGLDGGAICLTSALSSMNPEAGRAAYGASKSALNYIIYSLAEECVDKRISVTGIAPFILDTPANREWIKDDALENAQKPKEIGELIDFIFSNHHYLSGNIISLKNRFRR